MDRYGDSERVALRVEECDDGNDVDEDACTSACINAACGDGFVQDGEACDDGNDVDDDACSNACESNIYTAVGPQTDVPANTLSGWTECWSGLYGQSGAVVATIANDCDKANLMLACRPVGNPSFSVLAHAPRADVLFDTGESDIPHDANGVGWYYGDNESWGFAKQGDLITRSSCDTQNGNAPQRLCWHTGGAMINGGWRCGAQTGLNGNNSWERVVLHAD